MIVISVTDVCEAVWEVWWKKQGGNCVTNIFRSELGWQRAKARINLCKQS